MKKKSILWNLVGSLILAFGLYNIHSLSGVTEGGVLGLTLLLQYWFSVSPAVSGAVLTVICYLLGWKVLGKDFILYSVFACGGFSLFYALCERFPPVYPQIAEYPLLAAIVGAIFVGVGVGLCVRYGGAPSGDDALAMSLGNLLHCRIQWVYLASDLLVLALSLTYIAPVKLLYSLLTVILSGQIIGFVSEPPKWFIHLFFAQKHPESSD